MEDNFNQELYNLCHGIRTQMIVTLNKNYSESKVEDGLIKTAIAKHKANPKISRVVIAALESVDNYIISVSSAYFSREN